MPVITVTVYYGELPWDGATSLHGMLDIPDIMKDFVNDYRMPLVEARQNKLVFHNINNTDLFNLFQITLNSAISRQDAMERAITYCVKHHTDSSVIMTVAGAANIGIDYNAFEKGAGNMCTLFEEIAKEGEMKGELKGIQALIKSFQKLQIPYQTALEHLMENFSISNMEAKNYLDKYWK